MGKFETYKIDLKAMQVDSQTIEFDLCNKYFADIDAPEVQKGKVHVTLQVKKMTHAFELNFLTEGYVIVACDRCLDEMQQPVSSSDKLLVKFGAAYSEDGDNLIVIPEDDGTINVAWFIYEFIALAIPMKHVHAPGKCNKEMSKQLSKHLRTSADDMDDDASFADHSEEVESDSALDIDAKEEERPIDPRWNELKKILDNN